MAYGSRFDNSGEDLIMFLVVVVIILFILW